MFKLACIVAVVAGASTFSGQALASAYAAPVETLEIGADKLDGCSTVSKTRRKLDDVGRIAHRPGIPFNYDVSRRFNLPPLKAKKRSRTGSVACTG